MISLSEIKTELVEHLEKTSMLHEIIGYNTPKAFQDGFDSGVAAMQERAQVFVNSIRSGIIEDCSYQAYGYCNKCGRNHNEAAFEVYKKSMELK